MSWTLFYAVVSGLITLVVLLVAVPLFYRKRERGESLTNVQVVRQRLSELDREVNEGLISEHDKRQASDELKLALVDETSVENHVDKSSGLPIAIGAVIAIAAGAVVYSHVNQVAQVKLAKNAITQLPELSDRLLNGKGADITPQEISQLALAIRTRLRDQDDDSRGWMFLGRLWMSIGQMEQSIAAFERSISLSPEDMSLKVNYAQALMMTNQEGYLVKAQTTLRDVLDVVPPNDNLSLLMAVVSAQLGDLENAKLYFLPIESKLPADNPMVVRLNQRINELEGRQNPSRDEFLQNEDGASPSTGFNIEVVISEGLKEKLPLNGFLFVFAQDALSENRMPAAVVKLSLSSLPTQVRLTTDNAMLPNYSLAQLEKTRLVARISVDDNVAPTKGELEGEVISEVQQGSTLKQRITIDKELM